jgi:hypothetical protein
MVCLASIVMWVIALGAFASPRLPSPGPRLYALDCGTIDVPDMSVFAGVRGERQVLPDPCFLVVHPAGILLWDAGLSDELVRVPAGQLYMGFRFRVTRTLAAQLAEIGCCSRAPRCCCSARNITRRSALRRRSSVWIRRRSRRSARTRCASSMEMQISSATAR